MPASEKRKSLRRTVSYPAWINPGDGSPAVPCALCDASEHGAKLTVVDGDSLPDEFTLALSADGAATRHCNVVWRAEKQVGVEFVKPRKDARNQPPGLRLSAAAGSESEVEPNEPDPTIPSAA